MERHFDEMVTILTQRAGAEVHLYEYHGRWWQNISETYSDSLNRETLEACRLQTADFVYEPLTPASALVPVLTSASVEPSEVRQAQPKEGLNKLKLSSASSDIRKPEIKPASPPKIPNKRGEKPP